MPAETTSKRDDASDTASNSSYDSDASDDSDVASDDGSVTSVESASGHDDKGSVAASEEREQNAVDMKPEEKSGKSSEDKSEGTDGENLEDKSDKSDAVSIDSDRSTSSPSAAASQTTLASSLKENKPPETTDSIQSQVTDAASTTALHNSAIELEKKEDPNLNEDTKTTAVASPAPSESEAGKSNEPNPVGQVEAPKPDNPVTEPTGENASEPGSTTSTVGSTSYSAGMWAQDTRPTSLSEVLKMGFKSWRAKHHDDKLADLSNSKSSCDKILGETWQKVEEMQRMSVGPWTDKMREWMSSCGQTLRENTSESCKLTKETENRLTKLRKLDSLPNEFSLRYAETPAINESRRVLKRCAYKAAGLMTDKPLDDTTRREVEHLKAVGAVAATHVQNLINARADKWKADCRTPLRRDGSGFFRNKE